MPPRMWVIRVYAPAWAPRAVRFADGSMARVYWACSAGSHERLESGGRVWSLPRGGVAAYVLSRLWPGPAAVATRLDGAVVIYAVSRSGAPPEAVAGDDEPGAPVRDASLEPATDALTLYSRIALGPCH